MDRIFSFILAGVMVAGAIACSSTSKTAKKPMEAREDSVAQDVASVPDWFSEETVTFEETTIEAHATAIGSDEASAESKASERAKALLKRSVSDELEAVRTDAIEELGNDSGLADPDFLIAFRKVTNGLEDIISAGQTDSETIEDQSGIRGFAGVSLSKKELVEQIEEHLSSHEQTWTALKESKAFEAF